MKDTYEIYAYTFKINNKKYEFTSFHKSRIKAKLEFILLYLFGEPWELMEVKTLAFGDPTLTADC